MKQHVIVVAMAAGLAACSEDIVGPPRADEPIQTDTTVYVARYVDGEGPYRRYGFSLVSRFVNTTQDTMFVARCYLDSQEPEYRVMLIDSDDPTDSAYNLPPACDANVHFSVPPGAAKVDELAIRGPTSWSGETYHGVLEGTFRLHFVVKLCRGLDVCPWSRLHSNAFRVVRR